LRILGDLIIDLILAAADLTREASFEQYGSGDRAATFKMVLPPAGAQKECNEAGHHDEYTAVAHDCEATSGHRPIH
jgi:hypothetical protein